MVISCPACGHEGEVRGTDEYFEVRGQHPNTRMPVRKCRECGAGFEVVPKLVLPFFGYRTREIPADFWRQMEGVWDEWKVGLERSLDTEHGKCPVCGRDFPRGRFRDQHLKREHPEYAGPSAAEGT